MKHLFLTILTITVPFLTIHTDLEAFGGRGGGFGGRGGGGRGFERGGAGGERGGVRRPQAEAPGRRGGAWNRSPSMAHAYRPTSNRVATPRYSAGRVAAPAVGQYARPYSGGGGLSAFEGGRSTTQSQIQQFMSQRPAGQMQGGLSALQGQREPQAQASQNLGNLGNNVRNNIGTNFPDHSNLFNGNFWQNHDNIHPYARGGDVWRRASWNNVSRWMDNPIYGSPLLYDGAYGYVPYENGDYDNGDYSNGSGSQNGGQQLEPQSQVQQAPPPIQTTQPSGAVAAAGQSGDWLPLGVFAMTKDSKNPPTPNMYMQLAINKQGEIGGNMYVKAYNKTFPLVGQVDPKTQQAVWKMSTSKNSPYMETGLYNLTKNETAIKMTFADGSVQNSILVRMNKGQGSQ